MAVINGIEWCSEEVFIQMMALDSRLTSITKVHYDDFRQATVDTIVVKAVAGEHIDAGCKPLEIQAEVFFHHGKASQADAGKAMAGIEGAIFRPSVPVTTVNCPELLSFQYFDIDTETTGDRTTDKKLRNRVIKIPLLARLV